MSEMDFYGIPKVLEESGDNDLRPLNKSAISQFIKVTGSRTKIDAVVNQAFNMLGKKKGNHFLMENGVSYLVSGDEMTIYRGIGSNQEEFVAEKKIKFQEPVRRFIEESKKDDEEEKEQVDIEIRILDLLDELHSDKIKGGEGDKAKPSDFELKQVLMGIVIELEHTDNEMRAMEIALDHLAEDPKYYDKLKKTHKETGLDIPELPE